MKRFEILSSFFHLGLNKIKLDANRKERNLCQSMCEREMTSCTVRP